MKKTPDSTFIRNGLILLGTIAFLIVVSILLARTLT